MANRAVRVTCWLSGGLHLLLWMRCAVCVGRGCLCVSLAPDVRPVPGVQVAEKKKAGADATAEIAVVTGIADRITAMEERLKEVEVLRDATLGRIANILDPSVPVSKDEAENLVVHKWGTLRPQEEGLYHHHELLWMIDGYEPDVRTCVCTQPGWSRRSYLLCLVFVVVVVVVIVVAQRGVAVAGHRAYFLKGVAVQLNLALINYGLAFLKERRYTALQTPFFMNQEVMAGVAQLSEFDEALYAVHSGEDKKYLIATSEQPICAYHKDDWLAEKELPKR